MQIDIRDKSEDKVTEIVFDNGDCDENNACLLTLDGEFSKIKSMWDTSGSCAHVYLDSKEDTLNLIKALKKAIELGNWE